MSYGGGRRLRLWLASCLDFRYDFDWIAEVVIVGDEEHQLGKANAMLTDDGSMDQWI